ncbi:MAG: leucine-rich repeat domain-containing protein, partial [Methanomassiliicoccales archaeon]
MLLSTTFFVVATDTVAAAQDGDYTYTTSGSPAVATITGYTGSGGAITIPSTLGGAYATAAIGNNAFAYANKLTSVIIPSSVTTIGTGAFQSCTSLTTITIPNSVVSLGDSAFSNCNKLTSVTIGNGLSSIGYNMFGGCTSLTSVTLPNGITQIGDWAFEYCTALTTISFGSGLTTIGNHAFYYCTALTSITFLGLVAPTTIGVDWLYGANAGIGGHAYAASNFPAPGSVFPAGQSQGANGLLMSPGALDHFTMTGVPGSCTAGTAWTAGVVVTAYDTLNNIKIDFNGQVYFTSTDGTATLPFTSVSKYTFTSGTGLDNGVHTFAGAGFTLVTAGSRTITITTGAVSLSSSAITVNPAAIHHYYVYSTTPQTAGVGWTGTVTAKDAYNNTVTTDSSTVTMTNSGVAVFYTNNGYATVTTTYVLSSGVATIYVKDNTAQTITLTATAAGRTGSSGSIVIKPTAIHHFTMTGVPGSCTGGTAWTAGVVVTAYDVYNNI